MAQINCTYLILFKCVFIKLHVLKYLRPYDFVILPLLIILILLSLTFLSLIMMPVTRKLNHSETFNTQSPSQYSQQDPPD